MRTIRNFLAVLGLSALALATSGQEAEDEAASPPPAAESAADNGADATADDATPAAVPTTSLCRRSRFRADEEITFPVDI